MKDCIDCEKLNIKNKGRRARSTCSNCEAYRDQFEKLKELEVGNYGLDIVQKQRSLVQNLKYKINYKVKIYEI